MDYPERRCNQYQHNNKQLIHSIKSFYRGNWGKYTFFKYTHSSPIDQSGEQYKHTTENMYLVRWNIDSNRFPFSIRIIVYSLHILIWKRRKSHFSLRFTSTSLNQKYSRDSEKKCSSPLLQIGDEDFASTVLKAIIYLIKVFAIENGNWPIFEICHNFSGYFIDWEEYLHWEVNWLPAIDIHNFLSSFDGYEWHNTSIDGFPVNIVTSCLSSIFISISVWFFFWK